MKPLKNKKELHLAIVEAKMRIHFHEEKIEETALIARDAIYENVAFKTAGVVGRIVGGVVTRKFGGGKAGKTLVALTAVLPMILKWVSRKSNQEPEHE